MLSTLLQCCIVIVMQIKLTVVAVVVVSGYFATTQFSCKIKCDALAHQISFKFSWFTSRVFWKRLLIPTQILVLCQKIPVDCQCWLHRYCTWRNGDQSFCKTFSAEFAALIVFQFSTNVHIYFERELKCRNHQQSGLIWFEKSN